MTNASDRGRFEGDDTDDEVDDEYEDEYDDQLDPDINDEEVESDGDEDGLSPIESMVHETLNVVDRPEDRD